LYQINVTILHGLSVYITDNEKPLDQTDDNYDSCSQ